MKLAKDIQDRRVDPRTLDPSTRRALVELLADGTMAPKDIAGMLGVDVKRIHQDLSKIRREIGAHVLGWTVGDAVGYLKAAADACYARAYENGDGITAFSIRSNFVRQLKELGVIGKDDARDGARITVELMGAGLARATAALERAFRPELSGEKVDPRLIDVDARVVPTLDVPTELPAEETTAEVEVLDELEPGDREE